MKTQLTLAVASTLVLCLAACGSPREEAEDPMVAMTPSPAGPAAAGDTPADAPDPAAGEMEDEAGEADEPQGEEPTPADASPTPGAVAANPTPAPTLAAAEPPPGFVICGACHSVERGQHGIGPSLAGIFGTRAATRPGFAYSDAMEGAGLTWNQATLDRYLEDPMGVVPGTSMIFPGVKDAAQRAAIIDYLRGL